MAERRGMVIKDNRISIVEHCGLLSIHRSGFYYSSAGESDENLEAMRLMGAWLNMEAITIICPKTFLGFKEEKEVPINIYPDNWIQISATPDAV